MHGGRFVAVCGVIVTVAGCTTDGDVVRFQATAQQEVSTRDEDSFVTSRGRHSIVTAKPASHLVGSRPVFIVGMQNVSRLPLDFKIKNVTATEIVNGRPAGPLMVYLQNDLLAEEDVRNVGRSLLSGVLAGIADANSDEGDTSRGDVIIARSHAAAEQQREDLRELAIIDYTLAPGETFAGKLYIDAPPNGNASGAKTYLLTILLGPDRHEIQIIQERASK